MPDAIDLFFAVLRTAGAVALVVLLTRLNGLRTFSKMSGPDFAITVALGSILANAALSAEPDGFATALSAVVAVFVVQALVMRLRSRSAAARQVLDNAPVLVMADGRIFDDRLQAADITRADLMAKLREANVLRMSDVRAVVVETTGDVSVLHGQDPVAPELLEDVRP